MDAVCVHCEVRTSLEGRAMAEAASRRPLIAERSGFDLQSGPVRFVVDKVALGQVFFLRLPQFSIVCVKPPMCHTY